LGYLTLTGAVFGAHVLSGQASQPGSQAARQPIEGKGAIKNICLLKTFQSTSTRKSGFFCSETPQSGNGRVLREKRHEAIFVMNFWS